jgi:acyl-homoserine lactone acylase PvdQ
VLPPGQGANQPALTSQIALYDSLTALSGKPVGPLTRFYKPETLGLGGAKAKQVVRPKGGLTIYRDSYGVPHLYGRGDRGIPRDAGEARAEDGARTADDRRRRRVSAASTPTSRARAGS